MNHLQISEILNEEEKEALQFLNKVCVISELKISSV